jgi:transposase
MGLDQHRAQITADWLDTETGEVRRGGSPPADRAGVRRFLERFDGQELQVALEATTGWRFVVEELRCVGAIVHLLAEPAETAGLRGPKKRAPVAGQPLPAVARERVTVALAMIDALELLMRPIERELRAYARRQVGCRALMTHYGIGELTAVTILAELGDCRRFSSSRQAVRYAGMDTVASSCTSCRRWFWFVRGCGPSSLSARGIPARCRGRTGSAGGWCRFAGGELAVADPVVDRVG